MLMAGLIIECKRDEACGGIKLPIVNRPRAHSSVTDASGAHLRFQGPEPAVCRRCLTCHMGSQYYLPPDTGEPVSALYMGEGPDLLILLP